MSDVVQGRRLPDVQWPNLPDVVSIVEGPDGTPVEAGLRPGDYWKCVGLDLGDKYPTNLTRQVWQFYSPDGNGIGTLIAHTVRENADGTITIAPGDGSSNSVLHQGGAGGTVWHGYVDHGVWKPC